MQPLSFFDAYTCIGPRQNAHPAAPWSLDHLLEEMEHCSIDGALVASTACLRYDAMRGNRRLCEQLAGHEGLLALWHVFPHWTGECPQADALLKEMQQRGTGRAVVIAPATAGWDPLSPTSRPLFEALEAQRVLTVVDGMREMPLDQVERLVQRYAQLPILVRNLNFRTQRQVLPMVLHHPNLHVTFDALQIHYGLEWLVSQGCGDQLLFSSNAVDLAMGPHRLYVDYADVDPATRADIAGGNLRRLLGVGEAAPPRRVNAAEDPMMSQARRGEPLSTPVLDAHAHILDEGLNGGGEVVMFNGGPDGVHQLAQRLGVDGIGVMSWNGVMVPEPEEGNRCVRAALDARPGFFWGLATFDPIHDSPATARRKLEQTFADPRFLGLKPYPKFGLDYDDPRYAPWWEFGDERGLYAGLHPNRPDLSELDSLCPKYPNMTFIAYHCGQSYDRADAAIDKARKYDNFLAEITMTPVRLGVIDYLVQGCGAKKVVYGSDLPMRDPRQQLGWVVYSHLPLEHKQQVLAGNTQRLLDKVRGRRADPAAVPT